MMKKSKNEPSGGPRYLLHFENRNIVDFWRVEYKIFSQVINCTREKYKHKEKRNTKNGQNKTKQKQNRKNTKKTKQEKKEKEKTRGKPRGNKNTEDKGERGGRGSVCD